MAKESLRREGHLNDAWGGWAGESSRCEDPAPTVGVGGDGRCGVLPLAIIRHREIARRKQLGASL